MPCWPSRRRRDLERDKALLAYIARVTTACHEVRAEEAAQLRTLGWTDEAIYDAVTVCALFNFYVRWVDGCGVHEMSEADHRASGKRLAQFGYLPPQDPK
jgi:hypothetical protein